MEITTGQLDPWDLVRALRLLDPSLIPDWAFGVGSHEWLARGLRFLGAVDDPTVAQSIVEEVLSREPQALQGLQRLAERNLHFVRGIPEARDPLAWHALAFQLDPDLVVASLIGQYPLHLDPQGLVAMLDWPSVLSARGHTLDGVVRKPVAETHVHLAACLPSNLYWVALVSGFALARDFVRHVSGRVGPARWSERIGAATRDRSKLIKFVVDSDANIGRRLRDGAFPPFADRWSSASGWTPAAPPEPFCDPLLRRLLPDPRDRVLCNPVLGERLLLVRLLDVCSNLSPNHEICRLALGYLRTRNAFIRALQHYGAEPGLAGFRRVLRRTRILAEGGSRTAKHRQRRYQRLERQARALERFRIRHALRFQFSDPTDAPWARDHGANLPTEGLLPTSNWRAPRQVSFRVSVSTVIPQVRLLSAWLRGVADFACLDRDSPVVRVGFVFHIKRSPDWSALAHRTEHQLSGLYGLLEGVPALRTFVVGVDLAGAERDAPVRVVATAFRRLRHRVTNQRPNPGFAPIRLRQTCHAGEDYTDQLSGLRAVHESAHLLDLAPGERIGHALAAAWEPSMWYADRAQVFVTRGRRAVDLTWALALARLRMVRWNLAPDAELAHFFSLRLQEDFDAGLARRADVLSEKFFDLGRWPCEGDLWAYLNLQRGHHNERYRVTPDFVQLVSKIRQRVLCELIDRDIVVEACPTSNVLIGGLPSYEALPYTSLWRESLPLIPGSERRNKGPWGLDPRIPVSLNSDNPGVFHTNAENEFRLYGAALVRSGHRRIDVGRWLESARETGMGSSFIPRWSPSTREEILGRLADMGLAASIFSTPSLRVQPTRTSCREHRPASDEPD